MLKSIVRLMTLAFFAFTLGACGGSSSSGDSNPPNRATETVGPFDIQFEASGIFNHTVSFIPASPSGKSTTA